MRYNKLPLVCCLFIMFSFTATHAQFNYTDNSVTLRSDSPSKSVLVNNLFSDRIGDVSPVIGAAAWVDSGRLLQCRSLLEFSYLSLPLTIIKDPSQITLAELVLYPLQINEFDKPGRFIVRRVLESWEDSTTLWMNQPVADSFTYVAETLRRNQKNKPVSIDVTRLVTDMLRFGNKGFMISSESSPEQSISSGQWFASPKYDNENLRPLLVINFRTWQPYSLQQYQRESEDRVRQTQNYMQQQKTTNAPVIVPANTIPAKD